MPLCSIPRSGCLVRHSIGIARCSRPRRISSSPSFIYSRDVEYALRHRQPVVALESTIITHGMPAPANLHCAQSVESIIRQYGATPATIAVISGRIHVGLDAEELSWLAGLDDETVVRKASRRDLAAVVAGKQHGATTVAGTMVVAHRTGIPVFVTGGIGGVHRGAESSMDISADLTELGRTPVAVVCAGVKSILDVPRTLEVLETLGVPVVTLDESDGGVGIVSGREGSIVPFPAFFTRDSGCQSPLTASSVAQAAKILAASRELRLDSGIVIAVPIAEADAANGQVIQNAIEQALLEANETSIIGGDITPFILRRVNELTHGASLTSNIALIKNNARVGAQLAVALSNLEAEDAKSSLPKPFTFSVGSSNPNTIEAIPTPVIVGGCAVDITATATSPSVPTDSSSITSLIGTSHPGTICRSLGGVAANVARCAKRLGMSPLLISAVGNDADGNWAIQRLQSLGLATDAVRVHLDKRTAVYSAIHSPSGDLVAAVADMKITDAICPNDVALAIDMVETPASICFDGNISTETMRMISQICRTKGIPGIFEPTSVPKALAILTDNVLYDGGITWITPNIYELRAMLKYAEQKLGLPILKANDDVAAGAVSLSHLIPNVVVKMGKRGVLYAGTGKQPKWYPAIKVDSIVNVTGAGDSFVGALVAGLVKFGDGDIERLLQVGQQAAVLTLGSEDSVSENISEKLWTS